MRLMRSICILTCAVTLALSAFAQQLNTYRVLSITLQTSAPADLKIDRGRLIWKDLDQSGTYYLKVYTGAEILAVDSQLTDVAASIYGDDIAWNTGSEIKSFNLRSWAVTTLAGDAYNGATLQPVSVGRDRIAFVATKTGGSVVRVRNTVTLADATFDDAAWNREPSAHHGQLAWVTSTAEDPSLASAVRYFNGGTSRTVSDSNLYANRNPILRDGGIVWIQEGSRTRVKAFIGDSLFTLAEAGPLSIIAGYDVSGGVAVAAVTDTSAKTSSIRIFRPETGSITVVADPNVVSGLHVDNGKVIWVSGTGGGRQLTVYNLTTDMSETLGIASDPVIDDDHIAWTLGDAVSLRVPVTYEKLTTDVVNGWAQRRFKTIDNGNVLWGNHADPVLSQSTNARLFYAGTSPVRLTDSLIYKDFVTVNDGYAIWRHDFTTLYLYDGVNPPNPVVQNLQCENMYVADGSIGFHGFLAGGGNSVNQAWIYRIGSQSLVPLTNDVTGDTTNGITLVDGTEAVWIRTINQETMLMHYNGSTSTRITDSTVSDKFGFVNGIIVWSEVEYGVYQIMMLNTGGGGPVQITSGTNDCVDPFTDGNVLCWFETIPQEGSVLVYYDIATQKKTRVAHLAAPLIHWMWLSNRRVAWSGGNEVRVFDGSVISQLTGSGDFTPNSEAYVDDETVVWKQQSPSPGFPVLGDIFRGTLRPFASFDGSNIAGALPLTVTFSNRSWQGVVSYLWDFGDGSSSTQANPTHVYTNAGKYTVTLTVTGTGGAQAVEKKARFVLAGVLNSASTTSSAVPSEFALMQNYPNPFNGFSNFDVRIANRVHVVLGIYDLLGREVARLVNEVKDPGGYQVQWNSGNTPTGVYFAKMTAGSFVQTRRVVVMK